MGLVSGTALALLLRYRDIAVSYSSSHIRYIYWPWFYEIYFSYTVDVVFTLSYNDTTRSKLATEMNGVILKVKCFPIYLINNAYIRHIKQSVDF